MKEFLSTIQKVKEEIGQLSKDKTNPFYNSQYFDVNDLTKKIEPILKKHNLLLMQPIIDEVVTTQIINIENPEEYIQSGMKLCQTDPQKRGGEVTYYRRYALQSLLSLPVEDDDGNTASGKKTPKAEKHSKPWLNPGSENWHKAVVYLAQNGEDKMKVIESKYMISKANKEALINESQL